MFHPTELAGLSSYSLFWFEPSSLCRRWDCSFWNIEMRSSSTNLLTSSIFGLLPYFNRGTWHFSTPAVYWNPVNTFGKCLCQDLIPDQRESLGMWCRHFVFKFLDDGNDRKSWEALVQQCEPTMVWSAGAVQQNFLQSWKLL